MTSLTKKTKPLILFSLQTQRLAESFCGFEQLSSTINWRYMELVKQSKTV